MEPEWIALFTTISIASIGGGAYLWRKAEADGRRRAETNANFKTIHIALAQQTTAIEKNGKDLREHMDKEGPVVKQLQEDTAATRADVAEIKGHLGLRR